jgi:hypothetical protein
MDQHQIVSNRCAANELDLQDPDEPELNPETLEKFLEDPDAFVTQTNGDGANDTDETMSEGTTMFGESSLTNQSIVRTSFGTIGGSTWAINLERRPYSICEDEHGRFARVPLTQDRFGLCDLEDAEFMSNEKPRFYRASSSAACCYVRFRSEEFAHREIALLLGADDTRPFVVDHKNGLGLDNRRRNLRIVYEPDQINNLNRGYRNDSKVPLHGVFLSKRGQDWVARICVSGDCVYEETFQHSIDAAVARDAWAREHGLAVRCNNPLELQGAMDSLALTFARGTEDRLLLQHRRQTARARRKPYIDERLGFVVVPLSDGSAAFCDRSDIALVAHYSWHPQKNKYGKIVSVCAKIGKKTSMANYLMERNGYWLVKGEVWDHIDRNPLDNRKGQLKRATRKQNAENRSKPRNGNTALARVCQLKSGRYEISVGSGKSRRLMRTWSLAEAALFSDALLREDPDRRGQLNFPEFKVPLEVLRQLPSARRGSGLRPGNENGFVGVRRLPSGKYHAYLDGAIHGAASRWLGVGTFHTDVEAARARDAAAITRPSGRKLRLNFPAGVPNAVHEFLRLDSHQVIKRFEDCQARTTALSWRPDVQLEKLRSSVSHLKGITPPTSIAVGAPRASVNVVKTNQVRPLCN